MISNLKPQTSNVRRGFTLVEFLVVAALIGILATLTVLAMQSARRETRDAERVSAANQIHAALELSFAELGNYPVQKDADLALGGNSAHVLCEVNGVPKFVDSESACTGTLFMKAVPQSPTPRDGSCSAAQNSYQYVAGSGGTDFKLEFCIGKAAAQSGLTNGLNCVNPQGIEPGPCK